MKITSTRRSLLAGATAAGATLLTASPGLAFRRRSAEKESKRMLILGGTRFLGPEIVRAALDAEWEVTLFNRGQSNPALFDDLETRIGDRNTSDYASLAKGEWDLVVDTSCYIPAHVTAAIDALSGRAAHYVVVSTISVYAEGDGTGDADEVTEEGELAKISPEKLREYEVIQDVGQKGGGRYYGALKAECERAAREALPGKVTVVRPGLIVGPEDGSDRYTYWPVRVAEGGEVLAPGDPDAEVQYVDVRDLGPFTFDVGARRVGTTMNAVGFEEPVTMREMLTSCVVDGVDTEFTWATDEQLQANGVRPWTGLPLWIPGGGRKYANARAIEEGLEFRSLKDTAAATLAWHEEERDESHRWRAGISRAKEREVLDAIG